MIGSENIPFDKVTVVKTLSKNLHTQTKTEATLSCKIILWNHCCKYVPSYL